MLDELAVPFFVDPTPVFQIDFDENEGTFKAYACGPSQTEWAWVASSKDFNDLHRRCTTVGMAYDGATHDALSRTLLRS